MPPHCGHTRADREMLDHTIQRLTELSSGGFAERMRLDTAARLLVIIHRVLRLRAAGLMRAPDPWPVPRDEWLALERIGAGWNPDEMTASEFASDLEPADVTLLLELCPAWAQMVRAKLGSLPP